MYEMHHEGLSAWERSGSYHSEQKKEEYENEEKEEGLELQTQPPEDINVLGLSRLLASDFRISDLIPLVTDNANSSISMKSQSNEEINQLEAEREVEFIDADR